MNSPVFFSGRFPWHLFLVKHQRKVLHQNYKKAGKNPVSLLQAVRQTYNKFYAGGVQVRPVFLAQAGTQKPEAPQQAGDDCAV
jgi:hypothetical protein